MSRKKLGKLLETYADGEESNEEGRKPNGYWKEWDNLRGELERIVSETGSFPSARKLQEMGYSSLVTAMQVHHGGINAVREQMGMQLSAKPPGYWKEWGHVEEELESVTAKLGHFPTQKELGQLSLGGLGVAVTNYHGGFRTVRKRMGHEEGAKPTGYWKEWNNVAEELERIQDKLGHFPTENEIRENNSTLAGALRNYHGGIRSVRKRLGESNPRVEDAYYTDWSNIQMELEETIGQLGHFPSSAELVRRGKGSLVAGITRHHKGLNAARKKMGHEPIQKPNGYWHDLSNIESELRTLIGELGHFPTCNELEKLGRGSLLQSSIKVHGLGMSDLREMMGYEAIKKPDRYWDAIENVEKEIQLVMAEHSLDHVPTYNELEAIGRLDLSTGINKHGGYKTFRELFGEEQRRVEDGLWKDEAYVLDWARDFMKEHPELEILPGASKLKEYPKGSSFTMAVINHHGGFNRVRTLLGQKNPRVKNGHYHDMQNCVDVIVEVMRAEDLDEIPSLNSMARRGYSGMLNPIRSTHGGYANVRRAVEERLSISKEESERNLEGLLHNYVGGPE